MAKKTKAKAPFGKRSVTSTTDFHKLIRLRPKRPRVVCEGDSWFSYPGYNLIDHLERKKQMNLLRLEKNGDEAVTMMSGRQLTRLGRVIAKDEVDLILFSGGGNDVVGAFRIEMYLKDRQPGMKWKDCIDHDRFNRKMDMVENAYRMIVDLVDEYSKNPDTVILTHNYDNAIPDGRPAEFMLKFIKKGPWIKPFMEDRGITNAKDQQAIVTYFLKEAARRQAKVAKDHPHRLIVVKTFGTLKKTEWQDELHPSKNGFKKLGDKIWVEMQEYI